MYLPEEILDKIAVMFGIKIDQNLKIKKIINLNVYKRLNINSSN